MSTTLIEVRPAKAADAAAVASTHDEAWRSAYQGIIPGAELEKLINRRGPQWWDSAIRKGSRVSVLVFGDKVAGYANYGRNRARSLHFEGEIYELYLRPEFQGLGFGRRRYPTTIRPRNSTAPSAAAWWRARRKSSAPSRSTRSPSRGPTKAWTNESPGLAPPGPIARISQTLKKVPSRDLHRAIHHFPIWPRKCGGYRGQARV
jgi:GNAT superfamily N-acetyltransferase